MSKAVKMSEKQQQQWIKEHYQVATKYLAEKGVITHSVTVEESRYLVPVLTLWKITATNGNKFWVLCGDLPSDHSNIDVAGNARDALRHFSLKWQMQAENLLQAKGEDQHKFANLLISRADGLYQLYNDDSLWGQ